MKDEMSVSSVDAVNSAILHNMEIIIKMSTAVTIILTANIIIVFNCFQMSLWICKKQCCSLSTTHKFQKISTKKLTIFRIKLDVKNIKFWLPQSQS